MNGDNGTSTQAPQMRALLFTDLCDSLILVERIGDAAAAELFQEHDRLVLVLQQQWNGRLIDRSDGLLLLFERAIDGLGFALDYQRGLLEIGKQRDIVLRARAGLHVGEVLTWENSPEAIKVGAKSLEVEGLAKPMAARLMTLARPGQILLSAVAESLTHRAVGELGERGERLLWKSHGRWRFKGVPTTQEVFEVGEIDFAPLRMPRSNAKARRDIPLWRQPAALAAEALLAVSLAVGGWILLRPEPAIAFAERDWVVMGDVRNLTGNPLLDDSLDQAFRISLEQSRFVNVLSDLKVRDTLVRMQRSPSAGLDRSAAVEVALRDGARAVVLPSVVEVHGKLRVSVELVDPTSGDTVYSHFADGRGLASALSSTDSVVASLRANLGEALQNIQRDSVPLPTVATGNLDALHAYSKGLEAIAAHDLAGAKLFFEQAIKLDPGFAFAYVGLMRIRYAQGELQAAQSLFDRAIALRDRLTPRERLYLEAWGTRFDGASMPRIAERWRLLTALYPDDIAGNMNYSISLFALGRYQDALVAAKPLLVNQNHQRSYGLNYIGRIYLALGQDEQARQSLDDAVSLDRGASNVWLAITHAVSGQFNETERIFAKTPLRGAGDRLERSSVLVDQQRFADAYEVIEEARRDCGDVTDVCRLLDVVALHQRRLSGVAWPESAYARILDTALHSVHKQSAAERRETAVFALATAYHAVRAGQSETVRARQSKLIALLGDDPDPRALQLRTLMDAADDLAMGKAADALPKLLAMVDGNELFQVHVALHDAYAALGQSRGQVDQRAWLQRHRGLAYAEDLGGYLLQSMNLYDEGRIADRASTRPAMH